MKQKKIASKTQPMAMKAKLKERKLYDSLMKERKDGILILDCDPKSPYIRRIGSRRFLKVLKGRIISWLVRNRISIE